MNIILIGLRGSGKTSVGRMLAERLGREFLDTDEEIVRQEGQTIAEIFARGEAAFRIFEVAPAVLKPVMFEHRSNTWFVLVEDRRDVFEHCRLPNNKF